MLYSQLFGRTIKTDPKDEVFANAKLLIKGGFIDKLMSGSYSLLPLGWRVKEKIEQIIREEMNNIGAQELLMPLMHPKSIWNETGRWESAKEVMYQFKKDDKEFALSFTHEEIVLDLVRKHSFSYKDFPVKIYHFSTKFRNEPRAKSGVLRGKEFLMKDLYSLHTSKVDLDKFYFEVADAYKKLFTRLQLQTKVVEAGGGVFTDNITHEFQVLNKSGEDTIFYCENCNFAQNKDIAKIKEGESCPQCKSKVKESKAIEVGNIFRFGTSYSEKMNVYYINEKGQKELTYLGSYGIGVTRLIGTLVELFHDKNGIVWPEVVSPFQVHLVGLDLNDKKVRDNCYNIYNTLLKRAVEVLFDDREEATAGEKFADADLIGIPHRLVVSRKTGNKIGYKRRTEGKEKVLSLDEIVKLVS